MIILAFLCVCLALLSSFLFAAGLAWLICSIFGIAFTWGAALGLWTLLIIIQQITRDP